jgi:hypothetical protein
VTAELPGVDENDVDVTLANGVLMIRGEKKHERGDRREVVVPMLDQSGTGRSLRRRSATRHGRSCARRGRQSSIGYDFRRSDPRDQVDISTKTIATATCGPS